MILRLSLAIVLVLGLLFLVRLVLLARESRQSERVPAVAAELSPCPDRPNCVGSLETDPARRVDAFAAEGEGDEVFSRLAQAVRAMPGARIAAQQDRYLHAEFTSRVLGFVDDLELLYEPSAGVVHVRSASRAGYSDLGVNRKRVEALRARLAG